MQLCTVYYILCTVYLVRWKRFCYCDGRISNKMERKIDKGEAEDLLRNRLIDSCIEGGRMVERARRLNTLVDRGQSKPNQLVSISLNISNFIVHLDSWRFYQQGRNLGGWGVSLQTHSRKMYTWYKRS